MRIPFVTLAAVILTVSFTTSNCLAKDVKPDLSRHETTRQHEARMSWWRQARFGMFIHWGLYAEAAGYWHGKEIPGAGEWIMNTAKIPVAQYAAMASSFDPVQYNADRWVRLAKAAGMRYMVITAKHHEGFAMFHTRVDGYSIYSATPYHKDPLAALAAACRRYHMRLGFYYSQSQDWHHPGGRAIGGHWDPAQKGNYDTYLKDVAIPQVKELFSNYGKVSIIWWDTPVDMTAARAAPFVKLLKMQPGIISNNRLGGGFAGDYDTPEQTIPANGLGRDWETCMTINDTWGYKRGDHNFKSAPQLIRNLIDIASKGGNYLLNVGPTAEGIIPAGEVRRLRAIGAWMKQNGEAIYGTTASPFSRQLPWGRCTQKRGLLYLSVFDWPKDGVLQVPILNRHVEAHLLTERHRRIGITYTANGITLRLPASAPDPVASVIVLNPHGKALPAPLAPIRAAKDGTITLTADAATLDGGLQLEHNPANAGYWTDLADVISWNAYLTTPGQYQVSLTYADDPGAAGSSYTVSVGSAKVSGVVAPTASWQDYHTVLVGTIQVNTTGPVLIGIKASTMPEGAVMNIRSIVLTPLK